MADSRPLPNRRVLRTDVRARVWAAALAFCAGVLGAVAFDAWYRSHVESEVRADVGRRAAPLAAALGAAADRRIALLEGLRSFTEAQRTRAALDESFPVFAQGIVASTGGVRALQLVDAGRIVSTWPVVGNEPAVGYDLYSDARAVIGGDVRRALSAREVVITGPIALVQGGEGLLVRRRLSARPGFPELATIVLSVPAIVEDAGIPDTRSGLLLEARDRNQRWFGGDPAGSAIAPETLVVEVPDGNWTLLAAPRDGWPALVAGRVAVSRLGSVGFVLALTLIGLLVGARQDRLSRRVAARESSLSIALRAGRMGSWVFDIAKDHIEFDADAVAILGRSPEELNGPVERAFRFVYPDDAGFVQRVFTELLASTRTDYLLEYRVVLPDGATRWVLTIGELRRAPDGQPLLIAGVISDASHRRDMEARLRHSERIETVGTLAGGVAHDFNNLLTALVSFIELSLEQLPPGASDAQVAAARADLKEALRVAGRASGLTGQLMALSRRSSSEPSRVVVAEVLAELGPMLRRLLGTGIELRIETEPGLPPVWIEPGQLTQLLLNLVVNARDAIANQGEVRIGARLVGPVVAPAGAPTGTWVMLEVQDTGAGMSEAVRERVFEPYFTTKASAQGTGLGLAVVTSVVRAAGGHVTVASEEGKGTCFRVFLPPRPETAEHPLPSGEHRA
jgi:PAS domain S-box-containing protein